MAITYPLNTPTNIGIANITLMAENAVAVSQSPFTFTQQVVAHPGQRWAASVSLPPMKRVDAENWIAFLLSLKGQVGTFLLGDPNAVNPQGSYLDRKNLFTKTEFTSGLTDAPSRAGLVTATTFPYFTSNTGLAFGHDGVTTSFAYKSNFSTVSGTTYTISVFVVMTDGNAPTFGNATGASALNSFALVLAGVPVNPLTYTIQSLGSNVYRVSGTVTVGSASSNNGLVKYATNNNRTFSVSGYQVEASSTVTSYQSILTTYAPLVNGASQTGGSLNIDGLSPNQTSVLLPGDYIQLGSGSSTQLYKVLTTTTTNASGQATVDIWPNLRSSPADNSAVTIINTKGRFRLKDNVTQWGINEISSYGITFDCVEAL